MILFRAYRWLALVVGVLLAFCALVVYPAAHFARTGSDIQRFGESAGILWAAHGFIFMVYVVVAFLLSRRADWSIAFTVLMLVAGLIPLLIFFVERRVVQKVREETPELAEPHPV